MRNAAIIIFCALALSAAALSVKVRNVTTWQPLPEHMVAQLQSRTNGTTWNFVGPKDQANFFIGPPTMPTNFWLRDVTNILATSQGQLKNGGFESCANYLTPISPRICISAKHQGLQLDTTNIWLLPDGTFYTNKVLAALPFPGQSDTVIMLMEKTNTSFCKIFPYVKYKIPWWKPTKPATPPVFVAFHLGSGRTNHTTFVVASDSPGRIEYFAGQFSWGDYSSGYGLDRGDSCGPLFGIVNGEALLVGVAYTASYAPPIGTSIDYVNNYMAQFCITNGIPVETLTEYNLSAFPNL